MVDKNTFELVLQAISAGLVEMIIEETGIGENDAIGELYSSKLYKALSNEELKVWHYSVSALFDMWKEEKVKGKFEYPDY